MTSDSTELEILRSDKLGRDIKSSRLYKRIKKGKPVPEIFKDKASQFRLSVTLLLPQANQDVPADRPYLKSDEVIANMSESRAMANGDTFYCWAELLVEYVEKERRSVHSTPNEHNKLHVDIRLPDEAAEDSNILKKHIARLGNIAKFRPHPTKEHIYAAAFCLPGE